MLLPIIMAGGSGSRLWPLSRELYPKQFLAITSELTLLQQTFLRLKGIEHQPPLVICHEAHRFIVAQQLRQQNLAHSGIILEPVGRNTAPAIALGALYARLKGEDPLLLVLAADHIIQNNLAFIRAIQIAQPLASKGKLVTFGVVPHSPETGYGYIQRGEKMADHVYQVAKFIEKPNLATAKQYLETGGYDWNAGLFLFRASRYLEELEQHRPDILNACQAALLGAHQDLDFIRLDETAFQACPEDSVDYAVMEKTSDAVVVPLKAGWSDIGSWSALWEVHDKDSQGNSVQGDVLTDTTYNSYIYSQSKLVTTVGVNNLVVIETKDAVLVAHKDQVQKVKQIVSQLKDNRRSEYLEHKEVYRPWGSHDVIAEGANYRVKKVMIKPRERTATQIHYHRAEHWVVVSGTARVHHDDRTYLLKENESTDIPVGVAHAIENACKINPLEIIEVHTGAILDERDIKRVNSINDKK